MANPGTSRASHAHAVSSRQKSARFITYSAVIAALYLVLTWLSAVLNLSTFLRLSEALCVLVCFTPAAIPGITIGCFLSNLLIGGAPLDLLFGTLATLLGAVIGYLLRRHARIVPLPTVLSNALIIPWVITVAYGAERGYFVLTALIAGGETVTAWVLGLILYYSLKKVKR